MTVNVKRPLTYFWSLQISYSYPLTFGNYLFTVCFQPPEYELVRAGTWFSFLLYCQHLEQCLVHSRCSLPHKHLHFNISKTELIVFCCLIFSMKTTIIRQHFPNYVKIVCLSALLRMVSLFKLQTQNILNKLPPSQIS